MDNQNVKVWDFTLIIFISLSLLVSLPSAKEINESIEKDSLIN